MPLGRYERHLTDDAGNSLSGTSVTIEVRSEISGQPLAPVFSDRAGAVALGNPFTVSDGKLAFHAQGNAYYVRAYTGPSAAPTLEQIYRYQPVGLGGETDITGLTPKGDWASGTTYSIGNLVNYLGNSFASNIDSNLANTPPATAVSDANWTYIPATPGVAGSSNVVGTSVTSLTPALGANALTIVETLRGWGVGARLRVSSDADPDNDWFEGPIASYSGVALSVTADLISGTISAGPFADWTINLAGERGTAGAAAADYKGTSVTSLAIGTGTKVFTTQGGKQFQAGQYVLATSDADPTVDFMHGVIDSYAGTTLTITAGHVGGSGTHTDWSISISGPSITGATGPAGPATSVDDYAHVVDTANLDPATAYANGQTVGGRAVVTGETILRAGTTSQEKNGMYIVPASGVASRHTDYDTWDEHLGKLVAILLGSDADAVYHIKADPGGTLDTTAIPVDRLFGTATNTAEGLVKVSTAASADTGTATDEAVRVADAAVVYSKKTRAIRTISGTTDTLVLADDNKWLRTTNAAAVTVTVPPNSSVAYAIGTQIDLTQAGAGQVTFAEGAGVTISSEGSNKKIAAQGAAATLLKTGTDAWDLVGRLTA